MIALAHDTHLRRVERPSDNGNGSSGEEIPPVLYAALLASFGALAWVMGSDLVLGQRGTQVQFVASVASGFVGGPLGLRLTGLLGNALIGTTLGTIVTGAVYTIIAGAFPGTQGDNGEDS